MFETPSEVKNEVERKNAVETASILVVDDDESIRDTLVEILTGEGYLAQSAQTGKEAAEKCYGESFDLALIDIRLPDVEGTKLLGTLERLCPEMIKIIITGYPTVENAVEALNSGAEGYIVKPFKPQKLLDQIKEQLERTRRTKWASLLSSTGVSENEAKIYLSLAFEGSSEARRISMSSGVPRTKTYVALKKLVQRGLVNEMPGEIQRYSIAPPSGAFTPFVQNLKKDLSDQATNLAGLEQVISKLESVHKEKQTLEPDSIQKGEIWVIKGDEEIKRKIGELLLTAKTSVLAVTTEMGLIFLYKGFGKVLDNLVEKGVRVQLKVPVGHSNEHFVKELRAAYKVDDVKVLLPVFLLTVDGKELFLASFAADGDQVVFGDNRGIFCEEDGLVSFFNGLLGVQ